MNRGRLAFVFGAGSYLEHLPMARELIRALQDDDWRVDVYTRPYRDPSRAHTALSTCDAFPEGKTWPWRQGIKWLATRPYDGFFGACGSGIWCASVWAGLHRKPFAMLSDEISTAAHPFWRDRERAAHRKSEFTIVPDLCRWQFLREFNSLSPNAEVFELPNSPAVAADREGVAARRKSWGVAEEATCLLSMGGFGEQYGIDRFVKAIPGIPEDLHLVVHERSPVGSAFRALAELVSGRYPNVHFSMNPVPYEKVGELAAAADIGLALYYDADPNFALIGKASGKACYCLSNGLPVIHEKFDNLQFIADAGAGEPAHTSAEILDALAKIRSDLPGYKRRATMLFESTVKPDRYLAAICGRTARWGRR